MRVVSPSARFGSITDVDGVRVGHAQRSRGRWRTGTTVVTVPRGATPGVSVRGGGPGTRETDALAPENLVTTIHAVCLTGGSAYGLAAADGVVAWLERCGLGVQVSPPDEQPDARWVVPVVPAAVVFDLGRGGGFECRPTAAFGERAARSATGGRVLVGSVGAGTGALAGGLQGGVGTAGQTIRCGEHDVTVGALAVVNSSGSVIDTGTGLPFEPGSGATRLRRPPRSERTALRSALTARTSPPLNTTIGVVATSARLSKAEASKLADIAHDGIARAVRPAHTLFDGDTVFALALGDHELDAAQDQPAPDDEHGDAGMAGEGFRRSIGRPQALHQLFAAAVDCFALACTDAVVSATATGHEPAYRDLCPSVLTPRRPTASVSR